MESLNTAKAATRAMFGCSRFVKQIARRPLGLDVAWALIDLLLDFQQPLRSDFCEVIPFRKILSDWAVVVLHSSFFPRTIWYAEKILLPDTSPLMAAWLKRNEWNLFLTARKKKPFASPP